MELRIFHITLITGQEPDDGQGAAAAGALAGNVFGR